MKLQTSGVLGTSYAIAKLAPKRGYQNVIFEYNPANKFLLRQGATSTTKGTGQFIGTIEITKTTFILNGKLKSVKK